MNTRGTGPKAMGTDRDLGSRLAFPLGRPFRFAAVPAPPLSDRRTVMASAMARWPASSAIERVHRLADAPVRGMSLRRRPQLDDVHRLARVHLHVEPDAVRHRHRVRCDRRQAGGVQRIVQFGRRVHHLASSRRGRRRLRWHRARRSRGARRAAATRGSAGGDAADRGTRRSRRGRRSDTPCARTRVPACGGDSPGARCTPGARARGRRPTCVAPRRAAGRPGRSTRHTAPRRPP